MSKSITLSLWTLPIVWICYGMTLLIVWICYGKTLPLNCIWYGKTLPIVWICYGKGGSFLEISCIRLRGGRPPVGKRDEKVNRNSFGWMQHHGTLSGIGWMGWGIEHPTVPIMNYDQQTVCEARHKVDEMRFQRHNFLLLTDSHGQPKTIFSQLILEKKREEGFTGWSLKDLKAWWAFLAISRLESLIL